MPVRMIEETFSGAALLVAAGLAQVRRRAEVQRILLLLPYDEH